MIAAWEPALPAVAGNVDAGCGCCCCCCYCRRCRHCCAACVAFLRHSLRFFSIFKYCCGLHCKCVCVWHVRRSTSFASQLIHVLCRAYAAVSQPDEASTSTPTATASALSRGKHTRLLGLVESRSRSRLSRFDSCGTAAASPTFRSALRHAAAAASKLLLVVAHGVGRVHKKKQQTKKKKQRQSRGNLPNWGLPCGRRRDVGAEGRRAGGRGRAR